MKPDKLDIKIQEAAAQFEPVYNEQAWAGMKNILDEKMPQKKDKRKIVWIVFLFLLFLVAGSLLLVNYNGVNKQVGSSSEKKTATITPANTPGSISKIITKTTDTASALSHQPRRQLADNNLIYKKSVQNTNDEKVAINKVLDDKSSIPYKDLENKGLTTSPITDSGKNNQPGQQTDSTAAGVTKKEGAQTSINQPDSNENSSEKNRQSIKETNKSNSIRKINVLKKKNSFIHSFALNFSSGLDISAVKSGNVGKINLAYGAGISYQLNKRLTLRSGFYVEQKVYDADVSDYHPPARFWNYYPDLEYIDANCKVYEVPLIINYNFAQTKKHHWFGSVGLSSYFMKKEDYHFLSKNPAGQTSYNSYTINNKNHHYLSSLRLSAGYEKKIRHNISILAEPYFNLPLDGVGYGKVKLYSTGILFTLSLKPFSSKVQ